MEMTNSAIVMLVLKMKEIVIIMMSVKIIFFVEKAIAKLISILTLILTVVINQLLVMNIFVHLEVLVAKMKEIVILIVSVKKTTFVAQTTVWLHLNCFTQRVTAVLK